VLWFQELGVIDIQLLNMKLGGTLLHNLMQDAGHSVGLVVFAHSEFGTVGCPQECVNPAKMRGVKRIRVNGVQYEIELIATNKMGLGARALVSSGPELVSV
jgi:hypothetical protein